MTTTWNITKIQARAGQAFILPYPDTIPPDISTPEAILNTYFGLFYQNAGERRTLAVGLHPWAYIGAKGLVLDPKYKPVNFPLCVGLAVNAGKFLESLDGEMEIGDVSVEKFAEILSATTGEITTLSTSSTQYASVTTDGLLLGSQPYNRRFVLMYRWPSINPDGIPVPGEWDHILLPRVYFDCSPKLEFNQSKAQSYNVKVCAENDLYLTSPDSCLQVPGVWEEGLEAIIATTHVIITSTTADANGTIAGEGEIFVPVGSDETFTITPNNGYQVADVLVDGLSVGAVTTYTFYDVQTTHTIEASFTASLELDVLKGDSVNGEPETGNYFYARDEEVVYSFNLSDGSPYQTLVVMLDSSPVASSGSVIMDGNHVLNAYGTNPG